MTLLEAKENIIRENTEEHAKAFSEAFAEMVNRKTTVWVPVHEVEGGSSVELNQHYGEMFAVMFSEKDKAVVRPVGGHLISVDINHLIDTVYRNPRLAGIAIDPQEEPIYIRRKQIDGLTMRKDPRLEEREWGEGVPQHYCPADRMVIEELTDFAMDMVIHYAVSHGYGIFEMHSSPVYIPNLILERDGIIYYAVVEASVAPNLPELSEPKKQALLEYAKKASAQCLYAAVGIGSKDRERFAAGLALCGDKYIVNFTGFSEVQR